MSRSGSGEGIRARRLEEKISRYRQQGVLRRDSTQTSLVYLYWGKARHNLEVMNFLYKATQDSKGARRYYDWAIISGYYAMFHTALSALSAISMKVSGAVTEDGPVGGSHQTVIDAFEYYFHHVPKKSKIEEEHLRTLRMVSEIEADYVNFIVDAKSARTTAQYGVTKDIQAEDAKFVVDSAPKLLDRIDVLLGDLGFTARK